MKQITVACLVIVLIGPITSNSVWARGGGGYGGGHYGALRRWLGGHYGGGHYGGGWGGHYGGGHYGEVGAMVMEATMAIPVLAFISAHRFILILTTATLISTPIIIRQP